MKQCQTLFSILVLVLVLMVLLVVFPESTEARNKNKKVKPGVCKYNRKGDEGPCNSTTNTKEITLQLKKGDPNSCQPSKTVSKPCHDNSLTKKKKLKVTGCKYEKKGSDWSECDATTNEKSKVMKLKDGSNPKCAPVRTKTKSCGGSNKKSSRRSRKDS